MKNKKFVFALLTFVLCFGVFGCSSELEWDKLGGGGSTSSNISEIDTSQSEQSVAGAISAVKADITSQQTLTSVTSYDGENVYTISADGDYLLSGTITSAIVIDASNVHLFLNGVDISKVGAKLIDATNSNGVCNLIITVVGTNSLTNTGTDASAKNVIDCSGDLTINGSGTLTINSSKSGIKCDGTFFGLGATLSITASSHGISADSVYLSSSIINILGSGKDGIHAESDDSVTSFNYSLGFFYAESSATVTVSNCYGDGIQADTFVYIKGGTFNISTLPTWQTATSTSGCYAKSGSTYSRVSADSIRSYSGYYQLAESSKAIKVGEIDYGDDDTIVDSDNYIIIVDGGTLTTNSTDDALHANSGDLLVLDGTFSITTKDDAFHADANLIVSGGSIDVLSSYEGIEGQTVEISGGETSICSTDDGINAVNSDLSTNEQKSVCQILIDGGLTYVNAYGDGVDSNGGMLMSGGTLMISGPVDNSNGALDSENGIEVTGGTLVAIGSSGMVETPTTNSTQYCVSINLSSSKSGDVALKFNGKTICSFSPSNLWGTAKAYQSVVVSSPELQLNSTYSVVTGTSSTSVKITSTITKVGSAVGPER
jgi:hypothetical protein